jgi:peptide/nickel transport system permease protein
MTESAGMDDMIADRRPGAEVPSPPGPAPTAPGQVGPGERGRPARLTLRRALRSPQLVGGTIIMTAVIGVALLAPWLAPMDPLEQNLQNRLIEPQGIFAGGSDPGRAHILGTDELGRDLLSRIIFGTRLSLIVGLVATGLALLIGGVCGAIAGYLGGWIDSIIMRVMDVLLAMPGVLLAIAIVAALGPSLTNAVLAIAIVRVPVMARVIRGDVISARELQYVEAARALGLPGMRILFRHILPNAWVPTMVVATLGMGTAIVTEAALSFLGLGAQPPDISWGRMLSVGLGVLRTDPHVTLYPGLAIFIVVLGFNLIGDGLRDVLDVKTVEQQG